MKDTANARCSKCGKPLKDPFSIAVGMGPDCRGGLSKKGWKFPKPRYKISKGRMIYLGMNGKVTPPLAVNLDALPKKKVKDAKSKRES